MNDGIDFTLNYMKKEGIPLTRENFILINWMGDYSPKNLPAELEAEIPKELQNNIEEKPNE